MLQNSKGDLLLNGAVIYVETNVKDLQRIFNLLETSYQFEFYNDKKELLEEVKHELNN